jgi:hypothetical protein
MRKKLLKIVLHIAGVILFIFATAYALLAAYGYQIDLLHQNIVKTSIIDVSNELEDVEIYFDGELVAEKAPFQIKNVKPGLHEVEILKNEFTSWTKKVIVAEDVVTKLNDILLIPLDLEQYMQILDFGLIYDEVLINKNYFVLISRETNKIFINKIGNKNINLLDTINIDLENAKVSFIDMHRLQIDYVNNLNIIDLRDSSSLNIIIPDEFKSFKVAYNPYLKGYYLNEGEIYSVDISKEGVFQEIKMFEKEEDLIFEKLEVISSYDHILIKCDSNLYLIENKILTLIDENVVGIPSISSDGVNVIYLNDANEINSYNIYEKENILLGRFINNIESIKWHEDSKHLYLIQNENLLICDLEFSNCKKLFEISENDDFINNSERSQFIFVKKDTFKVYNLNEII